MKNVFEMTCKELEIAYAGASRLGDSDRCDEILDEMDRRKKEKLIVL